MRLYIVAMFGLEKYSYATDRTFRVYSFVSEGPNGPVRKIARFTALSKGLYNFGFGDYDASTGNISDTSVSNNHDTEMIMGTIGSIIYDFTNIFVNALIFITGSCAARTRLYQINISRHWIHIESVFEVFGLKNEQWHPFRKGINYDAFLGRRKNSKPI